jgi:glycosyltransferase involved in cell wall biosynthesis
MTRGDDLIVRLDASLPATLAVGRGHVLYLTGRCYHRERSLRSLWVTVEGERHVVPNHSMVRPDVPAADPSVGDDTPNSLVSGFWAAVPVAGVTPPRTVALAFDAELDDGTHGTVAVGTIALVPLAEMPASGASVPFEPRIAAPEPRVAICLATYNPDPDYFAAQVDSIIAQRHQAWRCIVSDDGSAPDRLQAVYAATAKDARFEVVAHSTRLGHYGNFERVLAAVLPDVDFVALADQDDVWYPEKLTQTLAAFRPETTLVYADMDVVAHDGTRMAPTYWTSRRNNFTDLASLLFANTVTGAASVFRAELLADVLPFPPQIGAAYHDHWIGCVALTRGTLGYVDASLHAYRQHPRNTFGHQAPVHRAWPTLPEIRRAVARADPARQVMAELWRRREVYGNDVVRLIVMAKVLLLRLGATTTSAKRAVLERIAGLERTPLALVRETWAAWRERRPTLGAEWHCLRGTLAARALDAHYRRHRRRLFDERVVRRELTGGGTITSVTAGVDLIADKIAPLRVRPDATVPERVNIVAPAIDFAHLFAGYLGKLNLARRLHEAGHRVRIVIVDPCEHDVAAWRHGIARYPGLEDLFDRVEVAYAADRAVELRVHPRDTFIATTWWTAHLAHRAAETIGRRRFVYLIQEFEPMTFPMGSLYALAAESYALPHYALFSTAFLRDYFRAQGLGVYADTMTGDREALTFENAIATFPVTVERLARPGPRKLLFYARPEQHAARNLFEIGILALRTAVAAGTFDAESWRLEGIGTGRAFAPVPLGGSHRLALLPRVTLDEYRTLLPGYDVGLSLMLTPHPSLVPLEMAAAGLVTVTNTFANKTAAALRALSSNLVPVAPTVAAIGRGLTDAVARTSDYAGRVAGSEVAWSRDWRTSFDDAFLRRLGELLTAT